MKKRKVEFKKPDQSTMEMLGLVLSAAWVRYSQFFGEQPHGTPRQMAAMLQLIPQDSWDEAAKALAVESETEAAVTTPPDEKQLRELLAKGTPIPWDGRCASIYGADSNIVAEPAPYGSFGRDHWFENLALIVAAVNALPSLLDELAALRKQVEAQGAKLQAFERLVDRVALSSSLRVTNLGKAMMEILNGTDKELGAAQQKCPRCGGEASSRGGHGEWCPNTACKWGWDTEMDGSPLQPTKEPQ
jgi:hypothetical protein